MLLGITIGQFLAPSASARLAICLIFSVIVYRTQSYAAVVIIPMVAIATTAVGAQIVGLVISYQISFAWLAILVLLITAIMVLAWDSSIEKRVGVSDVLLLAVIAATLRYLTPQSTWDAKDALAAVSLTESRESLLVTPHLTRRESRTWAMSSRLWQASWRGLPMVSAFWRVP
jgi:hypothetical protein